MNPFSEERERGKRRIAILYKERKTFAQALFVNFNDRQFKNLQEDNDADIPPKPALQDSMV
jgi:hypothetical protein